MSTKRFLLCCALFVIVPIAVVASDPYAVISSPGNFTIDSVTLTTPNGNWKSGAIATVTIKGKVLKTLLAGTVQYQIWEEYVPNFVTQANFAYFHCDHKGCDATQPVALALANPAVVPTDYVLTFQYQMVAPQRDGRFSLVINGQDQDHYPYDFSVSINYNYSKAVVSVIPGLLEPGLMLEPSIVSVADPYTVITAPGNFTIASVQMTSATGHWTAGATATITVTGSVLKGLTAGTLKYQVYEAFVPSFISQGYLDYFVCNNKGCDLSQAQALSLKYPTQIPTEYVLTFSFTMPAPTKSGDFKIYFHGEDQDHSPYDFDATIGYSIPK